MPPHVLFRLLGSFLWLILAGTFLQAPGQGGGVQASQVYVERHLILQGCKATKYSSLWGGIHDRLTSPESGLNFDTVSCVASDEEELQATETVLVRYRTAQHYDDVQFHVVAAILTSNHCEPDAVTCRSNNQHTHIHTRT